MQYLYIKGLNAFINPFPLQQKIHQKVTLVVLRSSACAMPCGANSVSCWPCQRLAKFHVVVPCRPRIFFQASSGFQVGFGRP